MKRKAIFTAVFFVLFFNSIYLTDLVNRYTISSNKQYYFIVIYFLLLQVVIGVPLWRKFNKARIDKRQIMKWILTASILSILIVVAGGEVFNNHKYQDSSLEITATGDKNQSSQSSEVWITGININSSFIDLDKFKSNFWEFREGNLLSYSNQPSTITIELPSAKDIKISFLKHQWSGIIKINDGGVQTAVDLYSPEGGSYEYIVKGNISSSTNKFVFDYMMATIFCFSLIFIILFIASTNHIWFGVFLSGIYILIFILTRKLEIDRISDILLICATFICGFIFAKITKRQWLKSYFDKKIKIAFFLIISLFSAFAISGNSLFFEDGVFSLTIQNSCIFILVFLWITPFAVLFLYGADRFKLRNNNVQTPESNNFKLWVIFFVIQITIGLFYLISFYPANMSVDSIEQWQQAAGLIPMNDWHPVFHTFIIRLLMLIYESPVLVVITQILFSSMVISSFLITLCRSGLPRKWAIIFIIGFSLSPNNGVNVTTIWKDIPYTISILWITSVLAKLILDKKASPKFIDIMSLTGALICVYLFRHNGIVPFSLSSLALIVYSIKSRKFKIIGGVLASVILVVTIKSSIMKEYNVISNPEGLKFVAPIHGIASVIYYGGELSNETQHFMSEIMPIEEWKRLYNPYSANPLMFGNNYKLVEKLSSSNTLTLMQLYLDTLIRNPSIVIYDRLTGLDLMWDVFPPKHGYNFRYYSDVLDNTVQIERKHNLLENLANKYLEFSSNYDIFDSFFWRSGLLTILCLLSLFYVYCKKNREAVLVFIPLLGNMLSLIVSMSWQDYRYVYFEFYSLWFVLATSILAIKNEKISLPN